MHIDWPIVVLALFFQFISLLFGGFGHYVLKLPAWIIPCIVFNNVTALPLAIITGLSKSGALDALVGPNETVDEMSARARVYILLYALVGNLCRYVVRFPISIAFHRMTERGFYIDLRLDLASCFRSWPGMFLP